MKKLFIAYARQDYPFTYRLVQHLRQYGVNGWMDATDIQTGEAISSEIRAALKKSSAMVVLVSPASLDNRWVKFEIGAGLALGIPIIPILVGGTGVESDLLELLQGDNFIDARHRPLDEVAAEVDKALSDPVLSGS